MYLAAEEGNEVLLERLLLGHPVVVVLGAALLGTLEGTVLAAGRLHLDEVLHLLAELLLLAGDGALGLERVFEEGRGHWMRRWSGRRVREAESGSEERECFFCLDDEGVWFLSG